VIRAAVVAAALPALAFAGCGKTEEPAQPPTTKATPPPGTLALGERITSPLVPLSAIAKDPASYRNRVIATSGKVTSVCQEMGCWLELQDETGQAHVRMHGHSFFVPKTSPGHLARVQATVLDAAASTVGGGPAACTHAAAAHGMTAAAAAAPDDRGHGHDRDCESQAGAGAGVAKIQLDATGVEID
jgi:Domain of unknown function (DUF4920)